MNQNLKEDLFAQATGGDKTAVAFLLRVDAFCGRVQAAFVDEDRQRFLATLAELNLVLGMPFYHSNSQFLFLPFLRLVAGLKDGGNPMPDFVMAVSTLKVGFKESNRLESDIRRILTKSVDGV